MVPREAMVPRMAEVPQEAEATPSFFLVECLYDAANHATQELRQLDGVKPHATPPHRNYFT
ncbi:hypothetical protein BCE02nite_00020 [Brevibacillus centrosporus]|nr:hypothetical protein BCE02nite_00020 [Brevibacillus centrosporus]